MVRYFTLDEANALLPHLIVRMRRAIQLQILIQRGIDRLGEEDVDLTQAVLTGAEKTEVDEANEVMLDRTRAAYEALYDELEAMEAMGVQLKGVENGLVDFPTLLDGETEVLLCWKLGEPEVAHYHHAHSGFAGRKPVRGRSFSPVRRAPGPRP